MISMHVKLNLSLAILLSLLALNGCGSAVKPALVPLPQKIEVRSGNFHLNNDTKIAVDSASDETGRYLAAQLLRQSGQQIQVQQNSTGSAAKGTIVLTTKSAKAGLGPEGYELSVAADSVTIRAAEPAGLFYGVQSFLQLIPPQAS